MTRSRDKPISSETDRELLRLRIAAATERAGNILEPDAERVWEAIEELIGKAWFGPPPADQAALLAEGLDAARFHGISLDYRGRDVGPPVPLWKVFMARALPDCTDPVLESVDANFHSGFYRDVACWAAAYVVDAELRQRGEPPDRTIRISIESYLSEIFHYHVLLRFKGIERNKRRIWLERAEPILRAAESRAGLLVVLPLLTRPAQWRLSASEHLPGLYVVEPHFDPAEPPGARIEVPGWGALGRITFADHEPCGEMKAERAGWATLWHLTHESNSGVLRALGKMSGDPWFLVSDIEGTWECISREHYSDHRLALVRAALRAGAYRSFDNLLEYTWRSEYDPEIVRAIYEAVGFDYLLAVPERFWVAMGLAGEAGLLSWLIEHAEKLRLKERAPDGIWTALEAPDRFMRLHRIRPERLLRTGPSLDVLTHREINVLLERPREVGSEPVRFDAAEKIIAYWGEERFYADPEVFWMNLLRRTSRDVRRYLLDEAQLRKIARPETEELMMALFEAVTAEPNVEVRRRLMEMLDNRVFLERAGAEELDREGEYVLYRVRLSEIDILGENFGLLHCVCPSTGHEYHLRVPSEITTARAAVAWTFGETVESYDPVRET